MSSILFTRNDITHHHLLLLLLLLGTVLHAMYCMSSSVACGYGVVPLFPPVCGNLCTNIGCSSPLSTMHNESPAVGPLYFEYNTLDSQPSTQ